MIDESCKVPRENLDDGFNPCRKQVVENGELCQYAHMYDVMNERYDREDETSYLDWAKRDKITSTTPVLLAGNNTQIYANSTNGEGRVNMLPSSAFSNPDNHTEASIPSAKAVADYVTANTPDVDVLEAEIYTKVDKITNDTYYVGANAQVYARELSTGNNGYMDVLDVVTLSGHSIPTSGAVMGYAPIPLPISKGGTGGNTPYVTDALDASSTFVMHDAPNDRYDAAPMSALTGYLDGRYDGYDVSVIPNSTDLNTIVKPGKYGTTSAQETNTIVNKPDNITHSFLLEIGKANGSSEMYQRITELITFITYERTFNSGSLVFNDWTLLYPTVPLPADQSGTGALVYDVDSDSTYLRAISGQSSGNQNDLVDRAGIQAMIDAAVANLAAKSDLENYVQKSTDTSAHGQVYAVTKDGEQTMEDIVVHLVES